MASVACAACGAPNPAADAFCGSCGAPLAASADAGPAAAVATPAAEPALVRCPSCGLANPATRTFCQSCGTKLPSDPAARRTAAVATSDAPFAFPTADRPAAVATAAPTPRRADPAGGTARGIPGWVVGVVLLGLLVGALVVGGSVLLRRAAPEPSGDARTAPPSAQPTPVADPSDPGDIAVPTQPAPAS